MNFLYQIPFFKKKKLLKCTLLESGSRDNKTYLIETYINKYILKESASSPMNFKKEILVQEALYEVDIASEILFSDIEKTQFVSRFLEGEHKREISNDEVVLLVESLKKMHDINIIAEETRVEKLVSVKSKEVLDALREIDQYMHEIVLCHNDLNPLNIFWGEEGVKIIDYEYAGKNDIYFDLASISEEFHFSKSDDLFLLESYFGKDNFFEEKLESYKVIYVNVCNEWLKNHS